MRVCCSYRLFWPSLQLRHLVARVRHCDWRNVSLLTHRKLVPTTARFPFCTEANGSGVTVLGIETSCDDTGAAVVNDRGEIVGEALHSQTRIHVE